MQNLFRGLVNNWSFTTTGSSSASVNEIALWIRRVPVSAGYIGRGMVGNDAKINLSELTGKFVGKPWSMYSCIGLMHDFYTEIDIDVPDEYKGVKLEEAIDYWKKAPR